MPGVASAGNWASTIVEAEGGYWSAWEDTYTPVINYYSNEPDGGISVLGPPDFYEEGGNASGWRMWTGHLIVGFESSLLDGQGDDLVIYHFQLGTPGVSVSEDLVTWTSLGNLLSITKFEDGGKVTPQYFDFADFGVDVPVNYVKIDKTAQGYRTGKFIDAAEGLHLAGTGTTNPPPHQPVLLLPTDGETVESSTPELQTEAFSDPDEGDIHFATQWQISERPDFSLNTYSAKSTFRLTSFIVPELLLDKNTTYYWRARYYDNRKGESTWSRHYGFTTPVEFDGDTDPDGIPGVPDDQEVNYGQDTEDIVDMDNNGISDNEEQDSIKGVKTVVGNGQIGLKVSTNVKSIDSVMSRSFDTIPDTDTKPDKMPLGLIGFRLSAEDGSAAEVTVYLSEPAPTDARWCQYDPVKEEWLIISEEHAIFSADGTVVTLKIEDGGYGDADGEANGVIFDPSGPGLLNVIPETHTIYGTDTDTRNEGGCFIATAIHRQRVRK